MKLKIKEINFESGKFNPKWWHWLIGAITTLTVIFKDEISRII
jgi:hypothetical protein